MSGRRRRHDATYRAPVAAGKVVLRALDVTVRTAGAETVPRHGPVLLAANHVSFPDFLFIGKGLLGRRLVRFMCRGDIWDQPRLARLMDAMQHIPVDRAAPAAAYLRARRLLREGEAVCVFPEAGIPAAYAVRALMPGAASLARETGLPLVPVSIWGSQRLWAQKRSLHAPLPRPDLTRGRLVDVRFGAPLDVPPDADLDETTRRLGHALHDGLVALQDLPEHRPRPGEWAPWYPAHLGGDALPRSESTLLDTMPHSAVQPTWGPT
ncbi:MAG: 1-acyl-sn-glycerol-3-phosphate acyltransferase [Nocardioides sp.]|nr:1-acyl-sn-glycerol-3-phosphate acyltransferase [Nocardioides sp.]